MSHWENVFLTTDGQKLKIYQVYVFMYSFVCLDMHELHLFIC